jgi:heptaprenyl diphosphate synthase
MMKAPVSPFDERGVQKTAALLGAFCLFLSSIEYLIPKPLPFMRLGIANLPLMLALDLLPFPIFACLAGIKVFGQALITGTLFSYVFLFSLAGTITSAFFQFLLRRLADTKLLGFAGIGIAGGLLSNLTQLALAEALILGASVRYIAVPFLATGAVTGFALGLVCMSFAGRSQWYASRRRRPSVRKPEITGGPSEAAMTKGMEENRGDGFGERRERFRAAREAGYYRLFSSRSLCIAGLCVMPALVFNPDTAGRMIQFLLFWLLAWLAGKKNNPLRTFLVIAGITAFNLLVPYGRVLMSWGMFRITEGALMMGIRRAVTLEGLIMLSRAAIRPDLRFPGRFGALTGESFRLLALIQERKRTITGKNWMGDIDRLMTGLSEDPFPLAAFGTAQPAIGPNRLTARGRVILILVIVMAWLPRLIAVM